MADELRQVEKVEIGARPSEDRKHKRFQIVRLEERNRAELLDPPQSA